MTVIVSILLAVCLIGLLILGTPICIAIAVSSIVAGGVALDFDMMLQTGAQRTFTGISVFTLIAIPFFILAGDIMNQGGIATAIEEAKKEGKTIKYMDIVVSVDGQIIRSGSTSIEGLPRGLYIINGKKYYVK